MIGELFAVIAPVFVIIGAGYLAVRFRAFPKEGVRFVMAYAQNFAVPLLLFQAMVKIDFAQNFRFEIYASYFLPMLCVFGLGFLAGRHFGRDPMRANVFGFNAFFANTVLLSLPIAERAYGVESLSVNFAIIAFHSPIGYLTGALAMEFAKPKAPSVLHTLGNALREFIKNPLIIGIACGLFVNLLNIRLPDFLNDAIAMQSRAALPVALFGLGGVLTNFQIKSAAAPLAALSVIRLFVHAALVFGMAALIFRLDPMITRSLVLIASMPTGVNGFIFASLYKREESLAASTVFLTTIISVFTIPIWLFLLGKL